MNGYSIKTERDPSQPSSKVYFVVDDSCALRISPHFTGRDEAAAFRLGVLRGHERAVETIQSLRGMATESGYGYIPKPKVKPEGHPHTILADAINQLAIHVEDLATRVFPRSAEQAAGYGPTLTSIREIRECIAALLPE